MPPITTLMKSDGANGLGPVMTAPGPPPVIAPLPHKVLGATHMKPVPTVLAKGDPLVSFTSQAQSQPVTVQGNLSGTPTGICQLSIAPSMKTMAGGAPLALMQSGGTANLNNAQGAVILKGIPTIMAT